MPRQNPGLLPSAANLLAAAGSIRAALSAGDFDGLKKGLTSAADGFEQAGAAIAVVERRLRDLGEPNVDLSGRSAAVVVSGDRIRGGIPVQGVLPNLAGQSLDLTFASQVAHVTSMDHGTGGYLELDLDGLGVTVNAHGGTITLTGTLSLSAPLTVPMGGTGTATGSITGTGALAFTSGGATTVALKPGTDSATAIQLQKAAGTVVLDVDTTNGRVGIGTAAPAGLAELSAASQPALVFGETGGIATHLRARVIYDGGNNITGGGFVFQSLNDAGAFAANLVTIVQATGAVGIGTTAPTISSTGLLHCAGDTVRLTPTARTPANSAAAGNDGEYCADSSFVYVHTGGSWRRAALSTF